MNCPHCRQPIQLEDTMIGQTLTGPRGAKSFVGSNRRQLRILIVDDEASISRCIGDYLSTSGFSCAAAGNGLGALDHIEFHPIDLVITDINMPWMNGMDLIRALRTKYGAAGPRIIICCGDTYDVCDLDLKVLRVDAVFRKPTDLFELRQKIRELEKTQTDAAG